MAITNSTGGSDLTAPIAGQPSNVYFNLFARTPGNPIVTFADLMLMHEKYIHVILVSYDYETNYHVHPDDFGDVQQMSDNGAFYVTVNFTASGSWMVGATFGYQLDGDMNNPMIEGFAQTDLVVAGNIPQLTNPVFNFVNTGRFRTYSFSENGLFDGPISVSTNTDPNGPRVELLMPVFDMMGNIISTRPMNTNITLGLCSPFLINVYVNDSLVPATMVPLLGAPAHLTIASPDDAAYHAHAIYILPDKTWAQTVSDMPSIMSLNQEQMMMDMMTNPEVNVTMDAMMMLGMEMNMSLDCQLDMGTAMMNMNMTSMNLYFGPPTFGPTFVGDFDWIQDSGAWRLWAWMKIMMPDGTEKLLVPNFDVQVSPTPWPTETTTGMTSERTSGTTSLTISFILMMLFTILTL